MTVPLVLSLFPGIGLLDMAFEQEGFCVVRGPDLLWGGDVKRFHPPAGKFEGIIGGPPCQFASKMRHINPLAGKKHGNLIPEFQRVVAEAAPEWFVMENVVDAPVPVVEGYGVSAQMLKDVWVGGETMRLRRISWGMRGGLHQPSDLLHVQQVALHTLEPEVSALAGASQRVPVKIGGSGKVKKTYGNSGRRSVLGSSSGTGSFAEKLRQQGLPPDFLSEAPFTAAGKSHAVGNGVPLPMGRAVAKAVVRTFYGGALRCGAIEPDAGYECELPINHDGAHVREFGSDERGAVPPRVWNEGGDEALPLSLNPNQGNPSSSHNGKTTPLKQSVSDG